MPRPRSVLAVLTALPLLAPLVVAAFFLAVPQPSLSAPVSPRVVATARGTSQAALLARHVGRYEMSRAWGVDRIYPQFALNLTTLPRDHVAHRNVLVVLCDFDADVYGPAVYHSFQSTPEYYDRLLFSDDPNDEIISMREYYRINSHGRLIVSGRVTSEWLRMPHSYAYYVNNFYGLDFASYPRSAQRLAEDAMVAAYNSLGQDLNVFDNDGPDGVPSSGDDDSYIDATIVIHPGQGAEVAPIAQASGLLWSHEAGITVYEDCSQPSSPNCLPGMLLGSKRGFLYTMNAEYNYGPGDDANGTYFHEFGHTLGLADLYEFSLCGNAAGAGLGLYSLMSYGSYLPLDPPTAQGTRPGNLDAWSRQLLGFEQPTVVTTSGHFTLPPLTRAGTALKVWKNGQPGTEYFLVENRIQEDSDEFLPGEGLLVYHVDDTLIDNCRDCGSTSCFDPPAQHYRVGVVQADGLQELEAPSQDYGDANDFFPGSLGIRSWTQSTVPSTRDYAGADTDIRMTNVVGAYDNTDTTSFDLTISLAPDILVQSVTVHDGGTGNSNGILDNGETDSLGVLLYNAGAASAELNLTLSTSDPGIAIVDGIATAPRAQAGATVSAGAPFIITVGAYPTLPHAVAFTLDWSDGVASGTETFTLTVGMGSGLSADFEPGLGNWTSGAVAPAPVNEWHLSTTRAYGGSNTSMKVGSTHDPSGPESNEAKTYADLQDAALVSPMFYLVPGSQLSFYSWIDAETNGGTIAFDGGRVEISVRGGAWEPLAVNGGYGYQVLYYSGATLRGADVFSGSPQSWRRVVSDLSAYSGPVQIRFRFSSDEENAPLDPNSGQLARYYEGWYVDDVIVGARALAATLDLDPNVINLASQAPWVTAYIEPSGFDPSSIALSTVRLEGSVAEARKVVTVADHNSNGIPDLMLKFRRAALDPFLTVGVNSLELTGSLVTGENFAGTDDVRVIDNGGRHLHAGVAPNPLNPSGVLSFSTVKPGRVSVTMFDLHGRLVRTLMEAALVPAGAHEVGIDGRGERGQPLASGLYFYRVEAAGEVVTGRVAILK